ncbi:MAG: hypothetical protein JNM89_15940 [Hyphomicrobiaceae bacterium]|nr:hypothetical protein [Hyphomicrobiaceae bacterium]
MIRGISEAVLTQALASAGNFAVSVLILRVLPLDNFGVYAYLYLIASFASSVCWSISSYVYSLNVTRLRLIRRGYSDQFNGFSILILTGTVILTVTGVSQLDEISSNIGLSAIVLFTISNIATDSLKLQAISDGRSAVVLKIEALRQAALFVSIAIAIAAGGANLTTIVLISGLVGVGACILVVVAMGWQARFNRLAWVTRRHAAVARYLLPSMLISLFHGSAIQMLAASHFGAVGMGTLRAAELPFSAVNPLKMSLNYFLPRLFADLEREARPGHGAMLLRAGLAIAALLTVGMVLIWTGAILLFPVVTGKVYPAGLGAVWAVAYIASMLLAFVNHYLNVLGRSDSVFRQSILGAVVAIGVYFATYAWLGIIAAVLAITLSFVAMTVYGIVKLATHLGRPLSAPAVKAKVSRIG